MYASYVHIFYISKYNKSHVDSFMPVFIIAIIYKHSQDNKNILLLVLDICLHNYYKNRRTYMYKFIEYSIGKKKK